MSETAHTSTLRANASRKGDGEGRTESYREEDRPTAAICDDQFLYVTLVDGRQIRTPLWWYPFLLNASPEDRKQFELSISGVWWTVMDEGLSIQGMLRGWKCPGAVEPVNSV